MSHVIQFGIPSLDELFGKLDVARVEEDEICPLNARIKTLRDRGGALIAAANALPGDPSNWKDFGERFARVYTGVSERVNTLKNILNSHSTNEVKDREVLAAIGFVRDSLNGLLDQQWPYGFETRLQSQGSGDDPLLRRIRSYHDRFGSNPQGKDRRLLIRMCLDYLLKGVLQPARHPMEGYGISAPSRSRPGEDPHTTSLCLLGPGGTGKSVLALHLASRYAADAGGGVRVFYASTDLSIDKAEKIWANFALDDPNGRVIPFRDEKPARWQESPFRVVLVPCDVLDSHASALHSRGRLPISRFLDSQEAVGDWWNAERAERTGRGAAVSNAREVELGDPKAFMGFLDLASTTAGDDWAFLCRLVADTPAPEFPSPAHLLVVDAIEGLEALVGEQDAFGETRSRRSRVAQLLQAAQGKFHVLVIVEERQPMENLDEEFITDAVVRVRTEVEYGYSRRTLSLLKVRGQEHIRGEHRFVVRSGEGSTTGLDQNADDPDIVNARLPDGKQSYSHVYHSLHYLTREVMRRPARQGDVEETEQVRTNERAGFNITHLDGMLGRAQNPQENLEGLQTEGLPPGRLTALIGDDGAHKSRLGRAWLSGCFPPKVEHWGIPVLITMQDLHASTLASRLLRHCPDERRVVDAQPLEEQRLRERIICRRLEVHDLGSSILLHIIRSSIEEAKRRLTCHQKGLHTKTTEFFTRPTEPDARRGLQERLGGSPDLTTRESHAKLLRLLRWARGAEEYKSLHGELRDLIDPLEDALRLSGRRHPDAHRIRLVIDDWSTIKATYPGVAADPLFLPYLTFYLGREGISTLIIDTQPGTPGRIIRDEADRELRALAEHHLYVWLVSFFGERRVAITALPPVSAEIPVLERELKPAFNEDNERLEVDPHFELYRGLDEGHLRPVPLEVRLHAETPGSVAYVRDTAELFDRLFQPATPGGSVVNCENSQSYDRLRDFSYLHRDTRMDHTLVFQVDEFWSPGQAHLYTQAYYMDADTSDWTNDPLDAFRPIGGQNWKKRRNFFAETGASYTAQDFEESAGSAEARSRIDRVPYLWDFGMLLCHEQAWKEAAELKLQYIRPKDKDEPDSVKEVWDRLRKADGTPRGSEGAVGWGEFLEACVAVARDRSRRRPEPARAFDVDLSGLETFSSLVFEIWASEMKRVKFTQLDGHEIFPPTRREGLAPGRPSLRDLMSKQTAQWCLYRTWLLLGEVTSPAEFPTARFEFVPRPARPEAVAARHWYSTASHAVAQCRPDDVHIPVALPGSYTTRGDWFLALAGGSRSPRLGAHGIDLLSSNRANVARLQQGVGLPTRVLVADSTYYDELPTALLVRDEHGHLCPAKYGDLIELGGSPPTPSDGKGRDRSWLWRSSLRDYERHARAWAKWLCWVHSNWHQWLTPVWTSGFETYQHTRGRVPTKHNKVLRGEELSRWGRFQEGCRILLLNLDGIGESRRRSGGPTKSSPTE